MIIKVKYCGYMRKDGTYNEVTFDTERKVYTDWETNELPYSSGFVEAHTSKDIEYLRFKLEQNGYKKVDSVMNK